MSHLFSSYRLHPHKHLECQRKLEMTCDSRWEWKWSASFQFAKTITIPTFTNVININNNRRQGIAMNYFHMPSSFIQTEDLPKFGKRILHTLLFLSLCTPPPFFTTIEKWGLINKVEQEVNTKLKFNTWDLKHFITDILSERNRGRRDTAGVWLEGRRVWLDVWVLDHQTATKILLNKTHLKSRRQSHLWVYVHRSS